MTVDFNDYFWGEKNNGFDVLYHNMKFGLVASKELTEFFREKSNIEEHNSKLMTKLANKAGSGTLNGTFAPVWTILRLSAEKLSTLHLQMVQKLTELVKDVTKYADELHKKHKTVKEEEASTLEIVQAMQTSTVAVQKSKDLYSNKAQELEKLKKDNGSAKEIEKTESKLRKLHDDYKALMDKHNPIKTEFERKMTLTCKRFQNIEEAHLKQMKEFLSTYLELIQNNHDMVGQVHSDFKRQFLDMTVDKLLEQFVLNKYTGLEKPEIPELELINLSTQPTTTTTASSSITNSNPTNQSLINTTNTSSSLNQVNNTTSNISNIQYSTISGSDSVNAAGSSSSSSILNQTSKLIGSNATNAVTSTNSSYLISGSGVSSSSRGISPEPTSAAATVKSNFRNWFTSSIPLTKHSNNNATISNNATTITSANSSNTTIAASSSLLDSSNSSNTITTLHNSPPINSSTGQQSQQQQQQQDNIQGSYISPALSQLSEQTSSSTNSAPKQGQQQTQQQQSSQQQQPQQQKSSRRTTSLLNLFMSNSQGNRDNRETPTVEAISAPTSPSDQVSNQNNTQIGRNPLLRGSKFSGILRSRRDKAKTKKSKKKKDAEIINNKEEKSVVEEKDERPQLEPSPVQTSQTSASHVPTGIAPTATPEVDEDGYSIQPRKDTAWEEGHEKGSFYSDSDSDSDNDKLERKIHVEIKPLNNGSAPISASVDELRATVENISLSPIGVFSSRHGTNTELNDIQMKRSQSMSQQIGDKPSNDLLGLNFFQQHSQQLQQTIALNSQTNSLSQQQSPEVSNASTPTATVHPYAPLQSPTLSVSNNSRYADLGDMFAEFGDGSISAPTSATLTKNNRQIPTPTSANSIAIPRPPSRRSEAAVRGRLSPSSMCRADSVGSMEFRTAAGITSSRGPSPLTIGKSDTIPLAVAFHEIIHAYFRGSDESRCQVKMSGDMMLSFPAGIVNVLANNPNPAKLGFRIKNVQNLENFIPNTQLVQVEKLQSTSFSTLLEFNMTALTALLRRQSEVNPNAAYFNVDILKYQIRSKSGASSCPFQLVSYWKCEPTHTALKVDYKYNNHAMTTPSPLLNVTISVPVDGGVKNVQSKPHSVWLGESNRLVWNFTDISQHSEGGGVGTLRARLEVANGPSQPSTMTTQFNCEGTTLSGIEFELIGSGYRLSLVKRRFISGKYICDGDGIRSAATPTPPSVGSCSPYSAKSN